MDNRKLKHTEVQQKIHLLEGRISTRLRLFRKLRGYSQTQMAEVLGCTFQQYQKYELGQNRISPARLIVASEALQVSLMAFVGEEEAIAETAPPLAHYDPLLAKLLLLPAKKQELVLTVLDKVQKI